MEENKTFATKLENEYKSYSMELAGRTLTVDIGRVGKQANGCAFMHYGNTTMLCTATASRQPIFPQPQGIWQRGTGMCPNSPAEP